VEPPAVRASLLRAAYVIGTLASLGLVGWVTWQAVDDAGSLNLSVPVLAGAIPPALASWLAFGSSWWLLSGEGRWPDGVGVWSRSQALRYLPGAVWAPLARAGSVTGGKARKLVTVVTEAAFMLTAALAVGGLASAIGGASPWLALLALTPIPAAAVACRWGRRMPAKGAASAIAVYTVGWVLYAVSAVVAQAAVGATGGAWRIAGASCLAWAAGFVVVFAPGGAGVREVAYVALVRGVVPAGQAPAGALADRLALTLAELAVLIVAVERRRRARGTSR
jgi:glycosyltransferase 2 family protein